MKPHAFEIVNTGADRGTLVAASKAEGPTQPLGYTFNLSGHRIFEGWKTSQAVRDLCYAKPILSAIRKMYRSGARPFQTINFDRGSDQKAHQDAIHFQSSPRNRIVGAWIALEDIHPDSGPLFVVPESAGMPFIDLHALGFEKQEVNQQYECYYHYEKVMERIITGNGWTKVPFLGGAGDALVWGIDILHGGMPIKDPTRFRRSLVVHYYLDDVDFAYAPMFGTREDPYRKRGSWFSRDGRLHGLNEPLETVACVHCGQPMQEHVARHDGKCYLYRDYEHA